MINFSQFLLEAQNYPLYHATNLENLSKILSSNEIKTGYTDSSHWPSKNNAIISTTRNFAFAKDWYSYYQYGAVIELDRQTLKNNYKIVPFNYFGDKDNAEEPKARLSHNKRFIGDIDANQYEEAITKSVKPALKYIKFVYMDPASTQKFKKNYGNEYSLLVRHGLI